ncbi:MAG: hypothetical protein MJB14_21490 [Spirochaetes bacterium]|nr:hypothetical protein [Spirochaetota bacterium]
MLDNLLFIIFAVLFISVMFAYYKIKFIKRERLYQARRADYIANHPELEKEQIAALQKSLPWKSMPAQLVLQLFGVPLKKRSMDPAGKTFIWNYGYIYILMQNDLVENWKLR